MGVYDNLDLIVGIDLADAIGTGNHTARSLARGRLGGPIGYNSYGGCGALITGKTLDSIGLTHHYNERVEASEGTTLGELQAARAEARKALEKEGIALEPAILLAFTLS